MKHTGEIKGDLVFKKGDDATKVTSIGGSLYVRQGATCDLPVCTSIGGSPSIGGSLYVRQGATCDLPVCTSIGGYQLPDPETARARLVAVAQAALADPSNLDMDHWHNESRGCGTSHCIAGWAVHLEPDGYAFEKKCGSTLLAGNVLLGIEASHLFFLGNDAARSALHRVLEGKPALEKGEVA